MRAKESSLHNKRSGINISFTMCCTWNILLERKNLEEWGGCVTNQPQNWAIFCYVE